MDILIGDKVSWSTCRSVDNTFFEALVMREARFFRNPFMMMFFSWGLILGGDWMLLILSM
ncbi:hypothetical protein D3C87_1931150 [compost metagenome]